MVSIFHRLGLNLSWRSVWTREMKTFKNPLPSECIQPRYIGDIYLQILKNIGPTEQGRYMVCQLTFDIYLEKSSISSGQALGTWDKCSIMLADFHFD